MKNLYVIIFLLCFYTQAQDDNFEDYNQLISDTDYNIEMIAIDGGIFKMGKDDSEDYETLSRNIKISPFWMAKYEICLLYTSPSPRDRTRSRMPSSA